MTEELLLALLRAQLGTGEPPGDDRLAACDWPRLEALAGHHVVTPILHAVLSQRVDVVPGDVARRLRLAYHANVLRNRAIDALIEELAPACARREVPAVLLKGVALLHTLYADPGLRRVGDIDLLVGEDHVPGAATLLEDLGFRRLGGPPRSHWPTCEFHSVYHRPGLGSIPIELHWRLFEEYLPYVFDLTEVWQRTTSVATLPAGVSIMAPEHQLAHLCTHLERHALVYRVLVGRADWLELLVMPRGLARLVWLFDVAFYLQRLGDGVDWERFIVDAHRWTLGGRVRTVFALCERALGVAAPGEVMRALAERRTGFVERQAHRAILSVHRLSETLDRGAPPGRLRHWCDVVADRAAGWSHIWTSLVPPSDYLRARYPGRTAIGRRVRHLRAMAPEVGRAFARRVHGRGRWATAR